MKEYQLKDLKGSFVKAAIFTIVLAVLGGAGMFVVAKHKQSYSYTAQRSVLISHAVTIKNESTQNTMTSADLQLMTTYQDIAENKAVAKAARHYLSKSLRKQYSVDELSGAVDAKVKPQSLVLKIQATADTPAHAASLVNAIAKGFQKELPKIQSGAGTVKLLAKASADDVKVNTAVNVKKKVAAGIALGGLIGIVISFVLITWKKILK